MPRSPPGYGLYEERNALLEQGGSDQPGRAVKFVPASRARAVFDLHQVYFPMLFIEPPVHRATSSRSVRSMALCGAAPTVG